MSEHSPSPNSSGRRGGARLPVFILAGVAVLAALLAAVLVVAGQDRPVDGGTIACQTQTWSPGAPAVGDVLADGRVVSVDIVNQLPSGGVLAHVCYRVDRP